MRGSASAKHRDIILETDNHYEADINLLTGLVLFVTQAADRVQDPVFYVKLGSIALALWFGVLIKRSSIDAPNAPPVATRRSRSLAAAASGCGPSPSWRVASWPT